MHNILKMVGIGTDATWQIAGSAKSLESVLKDASLILDQAGQINLHYTCHHVEPSSQREFSYGEWLFLDFDKIENYSEELAPKYLDAFVLATGIDPKYVWLISSGNGVHLLVKIPSYYLAYLEVHKSTYAKLMKDVEAVLPSLGLTGELDPIFHKSKSLRLPNTINRKEGKEDRKCVLLKTGEPYPTDLLTELRLRYDSNFSLEVEIKKAEALANSPKNSALPAIISSTGKSVNSIATPDEILSKCSVVQKFKTDMAYFPREEWLRAVGLLTTLGMEEQAHEWSQQSATYKHSETESIIESTKQKGIYPTSCEKIQQTYSAEVTSGCAACPYKACGTPARLFENKTMQSFSQGFYEYYEKEGVRKRGKINYIELTNFCNQYLNIFNVLEHDTVYAWDYDRQCYVKQNKHTMAKIFNNLVNPPPLDATEFLNKGLDNMKIHYSSSEASVLPPTGYIPLANGWLNAMTGDLEPYDPKWLVTDKIPVAFDPLATCPNFERFLDERIGDKDTIQVLLQYVCYALAGIKQPNRRILILEGPPGTGKTSLVTTFTKLFGHLYASAQLQHLSGRFEMATFEGKRLVYFDEAPQERDSVLIEVLKNLSGSPEIRIERKNENARTIQNYARMIISCNEIPRGGAIDAGFMDRLLIIPMHNQIENQDTMFMSKIESELSGILNLVLKQFSVLKTQDFQIYPTKVTKAQSDIYQLENDPVASFIEQEIDFVACPSDLGTYIKENCTLGSERTTLKLKNIRTAFCNWAKEEAPYYKDMTVIQLRKRMESLLKTLYKKHPLRPKLHNSNQWYLLGARFKNLNLYERPDAADSH